MLTELAKNLAVLGVYVTVRPLIWFMEKWDNGLYK